MCANAMRISAVCVGFDVRQPLGILVCHKTTASAYNQADLQSSQALNPSRCIVTTRSQTYCAPDILLHHFQSQTMRRTWILQRQNTPFQRLANATTAKAKPATTSPHTATKSISTRVHTRRCLPSECLQPVFMTAPTTQVCFCTHTSWEK